MKRFLILFVILMFLVGCGNKEEPTTQVPETQNVEESTPPEIESEVIDVEVEPEDNVPREYKNALKSAQNYIDMMAFSEQKLYDQLTSEYGEKYPAEAAQYAIENVEVDYNQEALESAQNYIDIMAFSERKLFDQLTSEYGEQFLAEAAQYAIDNLKVDYNQEALEAAMNYQEIMPMSDQQLFDQLTSEYGEQFTQTQAQYAIDNLQD